MNNYIGITTIICAIVLAGTSCKKFIAIDPPKSELTSETVFSDSVNARRAVNGIYMSMIETSMAFGSGAITLYTGLSADELTVTPDMAADYEFYDNSILPLNQNNYYALWMRAYQLIYMTNACIEGVTASNGIPVSAKNGFVAEARLLRAFFYFNLTNLYGNVPLLTSTDYNANRLAPGTVPKDIYVQVEADLLFAKEQLKDAAIQQGKASYYVATALLAKVYLYQQKYTQAAAQASEVIESGVFELETNPADVFTTGSKETIWALTPVDPNRETWEGYSFVPGAADIVPAYLIADTLYNSFEADDLRKAQWIGINTVDNVTYPFPYKYKNASPGMGTPEHYTVLRLAEQYLIRAEAAANTNNLAAAVADINLLRHRAGLEDLSISNKSTMLNAIVKERQTELFCEWGNRWFDLKRTGKTDEVLSKTKKNWKSFAALFPIPQLELTANPNLVQNPGY